MSTRVATAVLPLALAACVTAATGSSAAPIEDVDWRLLDVAGRPALVGPAAVRLRFQSDSGRAVGDGGCNRFGGPYVRDGASLRIGPLVSTRRACIDDAATRQESAVLRALEATRRHAVSGDTLVLSGDAGPLVRWVR
ncbi:META domain-containing protein [Roseisolibacter agri]|uniref:DUF306 domain-containing protein n=1 Tax=Roseisolibacter agri TaxID=2014610 RepID=A0AA37V272_9BACT|nr:META domain-containing protein [Roseisolibacter agri]GLC24822.1 hypothetical protein rosag_13350 [Roseisolibacter agri]